MARPAFERMSQSDYAKHLDISKEAVRKAIAAGKIKKGWDAKTKKIIVEKANEEWGNIHLEKKLISQEAEAAAIKRVREFAPPTPQAEPTKQRPAKPEDVLDNNEFDDMPDEKFVSVVITDQTSLPISVRIEAAAKAKLKQIEVRRTLEELVDKKEVYKVLFAIGQGVRQAVLAVPDRSIDEVLAAPNRAEAHQRLTSALHEALTKLSEATTNQTK